MTRKIGVRHPYPASLDIGESIAVMGVCLTVMDQDAQVFYAEVSGTTLALTTLGSLEPHDTVNLERAVTAQTRLGGHWVQGHVDGRGEISARATQGDAIQLDITVPPEVYPCLVAKGSIAIDGVSLTVVAVTAHGVQVTLIPHTLNATTLQTLAVGDAVNIEVDILAKYVRQFAAPYLTQP